MNYDIYSTLARQKLAEYGASCVLKTEERTYSKDAHDYVITVTPIKGVCLITNYKDSRIDGTIIQQGDVKIIFAKNASVVEKVKEGCTLVVGDDEWNIVNEKPVTPNGTDVILYELQGRR